MTLPRRVIVFCTGALVAGVTLVTVVNFTDACHLQGATLDGQMVPEWASRFDLFEGKPIISQPIDSLAQALLDREGIFKVDISYQLPHELEIRTNNFEPVCFVIGQSTGKLFGLNREGRLIRLTGADHDWERPVLTGVETGDLFSTCPDARVGVAIGKLEELRRDRLDLYRLINEVDFSNPGFLSLTISGLPFHLKLRAQKLANDMERFIDFVMFYEADLEGARCLEMRYDDMVICAKGDR